MDLLSKHFSIQGISFLLGFQRLIINYRHDNLLEFKDSKILFLKNPSLLQLIELLND